MQRRGEFLCLIGGLVLLSFPFRHHFERSREIARKNSCQRNLQLMAIAFKQYSKDNDERYPLVAGTNSPDGNLSAYGWFDALAPYYSGDQINQCPSEDNEEPSVSTSNRDRDRDRVQQSGYVDYWFNSNLAGVSWGQLTLESHTISAGDGGDGKEKANARFSRNSLPPNYAPARRHLGGANYAFADGHVKWILPSEVSTAPVASRQLYLRHKMNSLGDEEFDFGREHFGLASVVGDD